MNVSLLHVCDEFSKILNTWGFKNLEYLILLFVLKTKRISFNKLTKLLKDRLCLCPVLDGMELCEGECAFHLES